MTDSEKHFVKLQDIATDKGYFTDGMNTDSLLREDLAMDSLDTVEFIMEIEAEYDISIPDVAFDNILTIGDVIKYLNENVK